MDYKHVNSRLFNLQNGREQSQMSDLQISTKSFDERQRDLQISMKSLDERQKNLHFNRSKYLSNRLHIDVIDSEFDLDTEYNQEGGGSPVFQNGAVMYMLGNMTNPVLRQEINERVKRLGVTQSDIDRLKPHISLMEIHINKSNSKHNILIGLDNKINESLRQIMKQTYDALSPRMFLQSESGKYAVMGDYFAKVYTALDPKYITELRMTFYRYLEKHFISFTKHTRIVNGKTYVVYVYDGEELIAVPDYYHGRGNWTPHLSLTKISKISPVLYAEYNKNKDIRVLVNALSGVKTGSINQINMYNDFRGFRATVS